MWLSPGSSDTELPFAVASGWQSAIQSTVKGVHFYKGEMLWKL